MRFLSSGPSISKQNDQVVIRTGMFSCVLTFGLFYRQVVVDPRRKRVSIRSRYAWFFLRTRVVPFSQIRAITYGYRDIGYHSMLSTAYDSYDCFKVGVRLKDESEIHFFNFVGEGSFVNESVFPDWAYWSDFTFDLQGSQESDSRLLVDLLAEMIGVTVIPPTR
ncbi:MAG: hypothetical protein O2955_14020 [Planctomycetota bacterium]|nr:hypothetical protein [Planctomycetota bacterium]MDA1213628.1 hypothetical protein [Planctomycetota bacterium]